MINRGKSIEKVQRASGGFALILLYFFRKRGMNLYIEKELSWEGEGRRRERGEGMGSNGRRGEERSLIYQGPKGRQTRSKTN